MQFAVNYSRPLAQLVRDGRVHIDLFKCPAWPVEVADAQAIQASYVHFPLNVGSGRGRPVDSETGQLVDWAKIEQLRQQTETPFINLHLELKQRDYPDLPHDAASPGDLARMAEMAARDITAVTDRFGREAVIVENVNVPLPTAMLASSLPELIAAVVETTQTGLLLDISHARLAARQMGYDDLAYINALPVNRLAELHVTGIWRLDESLAASLTAVGADLTKSGLRIGQEIDHTPMTEADWEFFGWSLEQIRAGRWAAPQIVAFEYGGVSPIWEAFTSAPILAEQIPRMRAMLCGD